jgi:hypothetical protein
MNERMHPAMSFNKGCRTTLVCFTHTQDKRARVHSVSINQANT